MGDQFQYIKLPDGSFGKFSADASDEVIKSSIQKDFPDAFGKPQPNAGLASPGQAPQVNMAEQPSSGAGEVLNALHEGRYLDATKQMAQGAYDSTLPGMISKGAGSIAQYIQQKVAERNNQNQVAASQGKQQPNSPALTTAMGMGADTAGAVSGATSPTSAAIVGGSLLAPIPAAVGLVGYGGYQAVKNSGALADLVTKGQANPQQVQEGLSGLATMAGGAALGKAGIDAFPSKARAGQNFQQVKSAVGDDPIDINAAGQDALRGMELAKSGGAMPKVMNDFLRRVSDPNRGPLTYSEARDFYSNATRLSADEFNRLTPVMKAQVNQFTKSLGKSIGQTAEQGGVGQQYGQAMGEYADAAKWNNRGQIVADTFKKTLPYVAAGYTVKKVIEGR